MHITDWLEILGEHFPLVVIGCVEALLAVALLCAALRNRGQCADKKRSALRRADEILLYNMDRQSNDVCLVMRRRDLLPLCAAGDMQSLLGVTFEQLRQDVMLLADALENGQNGVSVWKKYRVWDGVQPFETVLRTRNGEWVQLNVTRGEDDGYDLFCFSRTTGLCGRIEQYEDRLAQSEEESRSKTTFLSRMSHEIRTPMNGIIGMLTLAENHLEPNAPAMQYLTKVDELSDHMLALINDILDMSRIEAGKVELESRNDMFGVSVHKYLVFDLADNQQEYTIGVPLVWCGKVTFRCISVQVRDMFGLFSSKAKPFTEICTVVYPHHVRVLTELSSATIGATRNDGVMQNRKGSDASEMFDIRDYVPGDDIRTIHWKLSGKTDELIVRQASAPSHYNIALLPDFGRSHLAGPEAQQELNAAVAIASSVAERLIRRGVPFCTVVPTKQGIERFEVCTERDFHELLPRWLSFPVQETGGSGLRYFVMEHLDRYFTRLLIFSAGRYEQDLSGLDSRVGVLVLSAVSGIKTVRVEGSGSCSIMELPTEQDINEVYRVVC